MSQNVTLTSSFRQPFRSFLLLTLLGLISFIFVSKAVGFILVQRETRHWAATTARLAFWKTSKLRNPGIFLPGLN